MSIRTVAAALLTLTALPAAAQAQSYSAKGTEPFWSLTIGSSIRFETAGRPPVTQPPPRVNHGFAGEIWQTRRINVNTVHKPCSDGMSDRTYSDTVQVTVDGRRYEGCGGTATTTAPAPGSVIDGAWRVVAIGGNPVTPQSHPTMNFRDGRVSGNASCNSYGGGFTFARGRLQVGAVISTKMACVERVRNVQESSIFQLLRQPLSVSSNRRGKLVLTAPRGGSLTLARDERR